MSNSRPWSNASAPCRLEWGASRLFAASLLVLGVLAAMAVIGSDLPSLLSCPLALVAILHGVVLARREVHGGVRNVLIPHGDGETSIDGRAAGGLELHWRGPLGFLRWLDDRGRWHLLAGCPDNLDADARRELRLAVAARSPVRPPRSVAP
ncbi:hypothetical protein [Lysobacter solisilvae (ex Woo and Kim 2020)]|uniref:Uncharacterized protein n=1 Tax=Agrilutibacter terrestris TaxID=2865112 RepID=A0A7H0FY21_9GAMM|nr:hypothetical protein [Lysobacter terrestris]QNP40937.1 hypothetical protein H8B22_01400 [Lysobacter terrestris]